MSASPFDLTGRVALITGAYRGLGFAIARGMAQAGATVILNGRKPDALASATAASTTSGVKARPMGTRSRTKLRFRARTR